MNHELVAKLFRGFSDPSRLRVLEALRDGPLHVGAVVARTGLSQPNVSMHLACLVECGLAARQRQGRYVEYRLADHTRAARLLDEAEALLAQVGALVDGCVRGTGRRRPGGERRPGPPNTGTAGDDDPGSERSSSSSWTSSTAPTRAPRSRPRSAGCRTCARFELRSPPTRST